MEEKSIFEINKYKRLPDGTWGAWVWHPYAEKWNRVEVTRYDGVVDEVVISRIIKVYAGGSLVRLRKIR
jgi:hypothetical protein